MNRRARMSLIAAAATTAALFAAPAYAASADETPRSASCVLYDQGDGSAEGDIGDAGPGDFDESGAFGLFVNVSGSADSDTEPAGSADPADVVDGAESADTADSDVVEACLSRPGVTG